MTPSTPLELLSEGEALAVLDAGPRAWQRSQLSGNTTRLMVGDHKHLELHDVEVRARVEGFRARVLIDFVFDNPDDETYEGTFQIRLPGEASPYFLAFGQSAYELGSAQATTLQALGSMDLNLEPQTLMARRADQWITPKEARIVPRDLANLAYDETVNPRLPPPTIHAPAPVPPRMVRDPALAEWAGAGVFNARVFPIAPRKAHRVVIGYDMDLERVGDQLELVLPMPQQVPSLRVDLGVVTGAGADVFLSPAPSDTSAGADGGLRYRLTNPAGPVRLRIPRERAPLLTGGDEAGAFFATRFSPKIPSQLGSASSRRAVFMIDTSMSARPEQLNTWLELMGAILERNRGALREFAVVFFDIEARWWREELVANTPANVAAALEHARSLALDGGSDLGAALDAATRPRWAEAPPQWDMFLLSDGAATWGQTDAAALARRVEQRAQGPLFAYRAPGVGGDPWLLQQLADATAGAVFSITRAADIEPVARAHRLRPWIVEGVALEGATDLLLDGAPRVVYPGQELALVGRGAPKAGAEVVLTLRRPGATGRPAKAFRTALGRPQPSELAARIYGQVAVDQLEAVLPAAKAAAEVFARHFRVPGKSSSLLMLETEQDYQRYGIAPARDAEFVNERRASELVARGLAARPADARGAFLAELDRLRSAPGLELHIDPRLEVLLPALPVELFEAPASTRALPPHLRGDVSEALAAQLGGGAPELRLVNLEAGQHLQTHGAVDAVRVLSSLIEARPGDPRVALGVAYGALAWEEPALAASALDPLAGVIAGRAHLAHAYALGLAAAGRDAAALVYFEAAQQRLAREPATAAARELLALDYRRFLNALAAGDGPLRVFAERRAAEIGHAARDADLVVTLQWTTPGTDLDLMLTAPDGATCDYRSCDIPGARVTVDATEGFGPEGFTLPDAAPGDYGVAVRYFSGARHRDDEAAQALVSVYRDLGAPGERVARYALTAERVGALEEVTTVTLAPAATPAMEVAR